MNWYLESGKDSDVVVSTRIRYARNLRNYKFNMENEEQAQEIEETIKGKLPELGYNLKFIKIKDIDDITKTALCEKHIISSECASNNKNICSILVNDEENICIMLNEKDHIKIQIFNSGFDLENAFNLAKEVDTRIDQIFDIAKSKKYGYLTNSLTDVGTGIRASVMVHLPGLTKTNNMRKILESVSNFGLNIRAVYGENSKSLGDLYQISNKQTLGATEEEIIKNLKIITEKVIEQERTARKLLTKNKIEFEDNIWRSFGILSNCKKISYEESRDLLSNIKLGTDLGILPEMNDSKVLKMLLYINPANLQLKAGQALDEFERDIKRAEIIQSLI